MIQLIVPQADHQEKFAQMMDEWHAAGGRINPGILKKYVGDYKAWLQFIQDKEDPEKIGADEVLSSTYFVFREGQMIGAVNIRHYLNQDLLQSGGHIAYGIRPSERGNGFAKKALELALNQCKVWGIRQALLTCDKDNEASSKVIQSQGGILENEFVNEEGMLELRYWIEIGN